MSLCLRLNERAVGLNAEREYLKEEQRKLSQDLFHVSGGAEPEVFTIRWSPLPNKSRRPDRKKFNVSLDLQFAVWSGDAQ